MSGETSIPFAGREYAVFHALPAASMACCRCGYRFRKFRRTEQAPHICRRRVGEGYLAIALGRYFAGEPTIKEDIPSFQGLVTKVPDFKGRPDHVASCNYRHGDAHRLLILVSLGRAHHRLPVMPRSNPQLEKAAVAWYGKLVGEKRLIARRPSIRRVDLNACRF